MPLPLDRPRHEYQRQVGLLEHYLQDHVDEQGVVWNQNWTHEEPVDYTTVDCALVHDSGC